MTKLQPAILRFVVCLLLSGLLFSTTASAQLSQNPVNTITVSPATAEVFVADEDPEKVFMITVQNGYPSTVNLVAELRGIDDVNGRIIPTGTPSAAISKHLTIDQPEFSVPPNEKRFVKIFAKNSSSLPAGGHYGSLVIRNIDNNSSTSSLDSQISVGVFLVKTSGVSKEIQLVSSKLISNRLGVPKEVQLEFFNNGNIHLVPRASIQVFDGQTSIYHEVINQRSKQILPGKRYGETVQIQPITSSFWPQKLTVTTEYRADGIDTSKSWQVSTWTFPPLFIIMLIATISCFLVAAFFAHKNRHRLRASLRKTVAKIVQFKNS